jgi:hypothetical protein
MSSRAGRFMTGVDSSWRRRGEALAALLMAGVDSSWRPSIRAGGVGGRR